MFHRPKTEEEQKQSQVETVAADTQEQEETTVAAQPQINETSEARAAQMNIPAFVQKAVPAEPVQTTTPQPQIIEENNQPEEATEERVMSQDHHTYQSQTTSYSTSSEQNSYDGSAYGQAYSQPQTSGSQSQGRRLVIGEGITMSGEIEACDTLLVEGTVEAALKGAEVLEISETGVFYGAVEIEEATIAGRFEGDITVNGKLTVLSSGAITGSIVYRELAVEAGAVIDGKISPMSAEASSGASKPAEKKSKVATKGKSSAPANELPFAGNASAVAA